MTDADQIARDIVIERLRSAGPDIKRYVDKERLIAQIASALTEARTAGFNEAKERALTLVRNYGDSDHNDDIHNEPVEVAMGIETAARDLATALQAMKQGGSDD